MSKEEEIQITVNILIEIIYEMYIRDLKNGKINNYISNLRNSQAVGNLTKKD